MIAEELPLKIEKMFVEFTLFVRCIYSNAIDVMRFKVNYLIKYQRRLRRRNYSGYIHQRIFFSSKIIK